MSIVPRHLIGVPLYADKRALVGRMTDLHLSPYMFLTVLSVIVFNSIQFTFINFFFFFFFFFLPLAPVSTFSRSLCCPIFRGHTISMFTNTTFVVGPCCNQTVFNARIAASQCILRQARPKGGGGAMDATAPPFWKWKMFCFSCFFLCLLVIEHWRS